MQPLLEGNDVIMRKRLAVGVAAGLLVAASAHAGTAIATLPVSATVNSACHVNTAGLVFGAYTPGAGNVNTQAAIRVSCARNVVYTVKLNVGSTVGGSFALRRMALAGATTDTLQYNLYTTTTRDKVFGDGTNGTATVRGRGAGLAKPHVINVYGQISDNATNRNAVPTGAAHPTYNDTITVTVTY